MSRTYALYGGNLVYWQGGRWVLGLYARALAEHCRGTSGRLLLLLPRNSVLDDAVRLAGWAVQGVIETLRGRRPPALLLRRVPRKVLEGIAAGIGGPIEVDYCAPFVPALAAALRRARADVVLPSITVLPARFPLPWVGYIPDLQHRHLPQFFTPKEIEYREALYRSMLERAPCVIVTTAAVKEDLARFYPGARAAVFELPFAPILDGETVASARPEVLRRYGIDAPFFLVSNQFWVHKNHLTAFRALRRLGDTAGRADVLLVCTGATADYRAGGHFPALLAELDALGVRARVRILGLVPRADQLALMSAALGVVQPSLFEGTPGGGSASDAVSLGVPLLASDIPANREIDAPDVEFFPPLDDGRLAELMARLLSARPRPSPEVLRARSSERAGRLARRLLEAAEFALSRTRRQ